VPVRCAKLSVLARTSFSRRSSSWRVAFTWRSASRRFLLSTRVRCPRRRSIVRQARLRAVAPRRSALRTFARASFPMRDSSRRVPAWLWSGRSVWATLSPPLTAAPKIVSAIRWTCQPSDFSRWACARARVSAALRAARLLLAAASRRVAAAFWAAALRCVSVWVAIGNHPSSIRLRLLIRNNAYPLPRAENQGADPLHPREGDPAPARCRARTVSAAASSSGGEGAAAWSPWLPPRSAGAGAGSPA
jgi:hypothetical protein